MRGTSLLIGLLAALGAHGEPVATIETGPLTVSVHVSATAHVFHIVDQLAAWSPYCHQQYAAHFTDLSDEERALLREHAALRQERPWGAGLEQTFYTDLPLDEALRAGIAAGHLTGPQAKIEQRVLEAFVPRAEALLEERAETLEEFVGTLRDQRDALAEIATKAGRLCGVPGIEAPVYLIANPDDHSYGGGFNGGRLTVEVGRSPELINLFLHEVMHVFLRARQEAIDEAAETCEGLNSETLSEGIAYALSPGMLHTRGADADPLRDRVASDWRAGNPMSEPYTRFNRYGLAVRPILKESLDDEATLETFLPRAMDAWRVVAELSGGAGEGSGKWIGKKSGGRSVLMLAPAACGALFQVVSQRVQGVNTWGRGHERQHYDELYELHAKPGDLVLLLYALDQPERVPEGLEFLLPKPWAEIEATVAADGSVTATHEVQGVQVTVLAAPTCESLRLTLETITLD